jgi:hypothetical protein
MRLEASIQAFAAALADPLSPPPPATQGRLGIPDARRFSVYRNNVAVGLIGTIEARYPVSRRIAGDAIFRTIARAFVRERRPRSPVMIAYGEDFPGFAADFLAPMEASASLAALPDVARLENAWIEAYHSADRVAASLADLAGLSSDALGETRVVLHPAARLLSFTTPAASLWGACQAEGALPAVTPRAEEALVTRPDMDVRVLVLPPGGYVFAVSLGEGATLAEAARAADDPDFEFGAHLVGLVESGAVESFI